MDPAARQFPRQPDPLRDRLNAVHGGLLRVHKALIDHQRVQYELDRGPVGTPLQFLKVVLDDPAFAWLRPMSELIVQIDEFTSLRQPGEAKVGEALLAQARDLLLPDEAGGPFQRAYHAAVQDSEAVAQAHGEWRQMIQADK